MTFFTNTMTPDPIEVEEEKKQNPDPEQDWLHNPELTALTQKHGFVEFPSLIPVALKGCSTPDLEEDKQQHLEEAKQNPDPLEQDWLHSPALTQEYGVEFPWLTPTIGGSSTSTNTDELHSLALTQEYGDVEFPWLTPVTIGGSSNTTASPDLEDKQHLDEIHSHFDRILDPSQQLATPARFFLPPPATVAKQLPASRFLLPPPDEAAAKLPSSIFLSPPPANAGEKSLNLCLPAYNAIYNLMGKPTSTSSRSSKTPFCAFYALFLLLDAITTPKNQEAFLNRLNTDSLTPQDQRAIDEKINYVNQAFLRFKKNKQCIKKKLLTFFLNDYYNMKPRYQLDDTMLNINFIDLCNTYTTNPTLKRSLTIMLNKIEYDSKVTTPVVRKRLAI